MFVKNIRKRHPWDKWINDGTVWEINTGNIIGMAFIGFFVGSLFALLPLMLLVARQDFMTHAMWFYKHQFLTWTGIGQYFQIKSFIDYDAFYLVNAGKLWWIYLTAYLSGFATAYGFGKIASHPISPTKHVRGRKLIADAWKNSAFWEIFRISNIENKAMNSYYLPMLSSNGLTPVDPSTYIEGVPSKFGERLKYEFKKILGKVNNVIWFSMDRLNTHVLIFGATRTGKSQLIKRMMQMVHRMQVLFMKFYAGTLNEKEKIEFEALTTRPYTVSETLRMALGEKIPPKRRHPIVPKMVIFGVKPEYSEELPSKYVISLGAHDRESYRWKMPKDLFTKEHAKQYYLGWIGTGDAKSEFWNLSQINYGASGIVYNQKMNGDDWTLGTLVWYYSQSLEFKREFVNEHYLEVSATFELDGEVMNNVIGSFGAKVLPVLVQLADIYYGFYEKKDIAQMTTTLLRREHNIIIFSEALFPTEKRKALPDGSVEVTQIPDNKKPQLLIRGLIRALNKEHPLPEQLYDNKKMPITIDKDKYRWTWAKLVLLLKKKSSQTFPLAYENMTAEELEEFKKPTKVLVQGTEKDDQPRTELKPVDLESVHKYFMNGCIPIFKKWQIWEHFETKIREVSLRDWLLDPMPEKPIIIFQSSGEYPDLNNGMIRSMTAYMTGLLDSENFPDNNKLPEEKRRDIWFFGDEFPFFGNMKIAINPILTRLASKGGKLVLAAQDLAQMEAEYDANYVKFICSNVGNVFVTGANAGETADKVSANTGKQFFIKEHTTTTGGQASSANKQQHEEAVLTPDEVTNELGVVEVNGTLQTRTLYMGARYFNDAYVFYSPVVKYKQKHKFKPAYWTMKDFAFPEKPVDIKELLATFDGDIPTAETSSDSGSVVNPAFDDLSDEPGQEFSEEDQEALASQEKEEYLQARKVVQQIQDNTPDLPLELDEEELEQEMIAEKLIEEIFGHEIGMMKISLEIIDNLLYSKQIKLKPEEKKLILKYMNKKHPEGPDTRRRIPIEELMGD